MPRSASRNFLGIAGAILALLPGLAQARTAPPDPKLYAALDDRQLGQINAIVRLAQQPDSDWSSMGAQEPGQGGFDAYRYQLAMMSYALALANHHYVPAYRDLYRDVDARLISKMMLFDVWGYWELTSRGSKMFDPSLTVLSEGWIDPVKDQNIMYSGHLFQMINTHEMLYNDDQYEKPNSIKFVYNPIGRGLGKQEFDYDNTALAATLARQFEANGWKGIECEPNAIFPECNQHPLLGYALFDRSHATNYFPTISGEFKKQFDELSYVDPKTSSFMALYFIKQKRVMQAPAAWQDGWAGSFMHAWDKETVETIYPTQKARFIVTLPDGTQTIRSKDQNPTYSWDHGFFAVLAAETGDELTRKAMLDYADKYWSPVWRADALVYPRKDRFRFDSDGPNVWRRIQPLTANGLLALARMNYRDGLYELFNKPFAKDHFSEPYVTGVNYPQTQVSRAVWDRDSKALVVTVAPQRGASRTMSIWSIANLDSTKRYALWRDGKKVSDIDTPGLHRTGAYELEIADGRLTVKAPLAKETSFVLTED